jgi:hypothetical protein
VSIWTFSPTSEEDQIVFSIVWKSECFFSVATEVILRLKVLVKEIASRVCRVSREGTSPGWGAFSSQNKRSGNRPCQKKSVVPFPCHLPSPQLLLLCAWSDSRSVGPLCHQSAFLLRDPPASLGKAVSEALAWDQGPHQCFSAGARQEDPDQLSSL